MTDWTPTVEERTGSVSADSARSLHDLLDGLGRAPGVGDPLPPLWHWMTFTPVARPSELGDDGHPALGTFLPPLGNSRRMFAGGTLTFDGSPAVGEELARRSEVVGTREKNGRSGPLTFVDVEQRVSHDNRDAVIEVQNIVYLPATTDKATPAETTPITTTPTEDAAQTVDIGTWDWQLELPTDSRTLFRFSALTYNAHRIHYDRPYAMDVEGYPGLVVHGPYQAVALAEICRRHVSDPLASFTFRAVRPAFDGPPLRIVGRRDTDDEVTLAAFDRYGRETMTARATLARE